MGIDYATVGEFYAALAEGLRALAARWASPPRSAATRRCSSPGSEIDLAGANRVICLKTALAAFDSIVRQGEGAPGRSADSHFERFAAIRSEFRALKAANPDFASGHPAATNPVLRRPPRPEGRVWIEAEPAIATVDLANAAYGLMLRLIAYAYAVARPPPDKALASIWLSA